MYKGKIVEHGPVEHILHFRLSIPIPKNW
jgi:ABC-type dipeptide/oligopeptide/nickel transport system ATPase component